MNQNPDPREPERSTPLSTAAFPAVPRPLSLDDPMVQRVVKRRLDVLFVAVVKAAVALRRGEAGWGDLTEELEVVRAVGRDLIAALKAGRTGRRSPSARWGRLVATLLTAFDARDLAGTGVGADPTDQAPAGRGEGVEGADTSMGQEAPPCL